jgi:hypothetical protein
MTKGGNRQARWKLPAAAKRRRLSKCAIDAGGRKSNGWASKAHPLSELLLTRRPTSYAVTAASLATTANQPTSHARAALD